MGFTLSSSVVLRSIILSLDYDRSPIWILSCKCKSLRFNRYNFLDWTLPSAPVASGWKVLKEFPAWTPAGANSVFFKLTAMRGRRFSLSVTSKAKRGKHVNSLELIRFKSPRKWCVSFFWNIYECICFVSVFTLENVELENVYLFLRWTRARIKIYIFISTRLVSDFWPQLLLLNYPFALLYDQYSYINISFILGSVSSYLCISSVPSSLCFVSSPVISYCHLSFHCMSLHFSNEQR